MKRLKPALLAVCLSCGLAASAFAADAVKTRPFNAMPADFIKGADISTLLEAEQHGAKFYNQNGQQQDAIAILKANGVNYVRLRLWVDPQDASGKTYGGGSNNLENTIALAKRVKALGLKLLLDFHYSDFWTDPGKQFKPKAWEKMDYPQLKTAIHDYTRDTIARFKQEGVLPDMVQIGNEINGGMLWPEGKSWGQGGGEFDRLAGLLNAAIGGLKENLTGGEQVKIMLHLAEGTKNDTFRWWFDEIAKRGVPFDIIGLSMYTYWNGPISALKANMDDISRRYNKDVIVVEAAYGYTLDNCDNAENSFQAKEEKDGGYPGTVQGQYDYIHDLMQSVIDVPDHRGKGIFYWEPTWIAVPGTTWATKAGMKYIHDEWKEGNARENQALFDCQGKVLPSITVFK
ncbi:TPA: arabinogalactan endo-beta-1,4-galactanase [Enterobacter cloacae]|jgi:arabinogalactan endo-1,4-beta-galactosidase|uniref:glycoside hydrolase family 53 protein n=1 Tax=Enterobacter cloacae TaxID=550 RepID=UPI0021830097|nr:arabinogalactan endo-beta-1,4-galactanase [Enterobacter cloacae]ELV2842202.1 arabinogalactan endo-beta-1,4-galactanase [Enterobacter cloacae]EMC0023369.1 arabinogalactan endo-beta-1,4-galactanase [Enterobacter cloacae]MCT2765668.1 arabinogalactan endo-beta-1,4-galactanase [Enterobacter cloacae]MCU6281601.1 arabinogalactan endo-beta-1,4-galactanase [Enterobacter cloacae]MDR1752441.1 arabinogalactan endo-beta-1,4-galactanase [Enterobacter cloacae]